MFPTRLVGHSPPTFLAFLSTASTGVLRHLWLRRPPLRVAAARPTMTPGARPVRGHGHGHSHGHGVGGGYYGLPVDPGARAGPPTPPLPASTSSRGPRSAGPAAAASRGLLGVSGGVVKRAKTKFYAVAHGRGGPAVYRTWAECQRQVQGVPGARFKSFRTLAEAQTFAASGGPLGRGGGGGGAPPRRRPPRHWCREWTRRCGAGSPVWVVPPPAAVRPAFPLRPPAGCGGSTPPRRPRRRSRPPPRPASRGRWSR